jgi:hypothetical protein
MKRYKEQESGAVEKWFEGENIIGSLVKGDFPHERELRVSNKRGSISSRGTFNISDKKLVEKIKRMAKEIR